MSGSGPEARIVRVEVFGYDLSYAHGRYVMSKGREVTTLPSTVVVLTTASGARGYGEVCPLGPNYLPAFAAGARAALAELAPALLGREVTAPAALYRTMDGALAGHAYAKSAVDIACHDALGRLSGLPVSTLLGGRQVEQLPIYVAVPLAGPGEMAEFIAARRAEGVHRFQLKLGGDPREDAARVRAALEATTEEDLLVADANGGWRLADAVTAVRLLEDAPRLFLEQPCPTLEECLQVRRRTSLPMILDEVIVGPAALLRAVSARAMEGVNLKINRVGGLTPARLLRDLCVELGLSLTIEDSWGGDLTTAAVSHLAASTPGEQLLSTSFMNDWTNEHVAGHEPRARGGVGSAPLGSGLGVSVDDSMLGSRLFDCS